jgi:hypothetical protein
MLRRFLIPVALVTFTLLGPVSTTTAQSDSLAYRDLVTADDFRLRVAAALALGKSKSPNARGALEKALKDRHTAVRAAAAAALAALGDAAALPALRAALGSEGTVNVKLQLESTIQRLSSKAPSKAKFLVTLGKMENRSPVKDRTVNSALRDETRAKAAMIPGVEVLADGVDAARTGKSRNLPVFTLDATLTKLAKGAKGADISYSASVEYLIRKVPEQALKGSMIGSASALAEAATVKGPSHHAQLQRDAVAGAVESAFKGAGSAFEVASGNKR